MALYVVQVSDPPAGTDWQAVVPGQYLYDITAITGTLSVPSGPDAPTDYSGNGNDGTYVTQGGPPQFSAAGAFNGDDCLISSATPAAGYLAGWRMPSSALPIETVGSFTLGFWRNTTEAAGAGICWFTSGGGLCTQAFNGNSTVLEWTTQLGGGQWSTPNIYPFDNAWHFIVYAYDAGTQEMKIYFDGANVPLDNDTPGAAFGAVSDRIGWDCDAGVGVTGRGLTDEVFFVPVTLSAGAIATLYATAPNFAQWTADILALTPITAYHLDGLGPPPGGRTPALDITDGSHVVVRIGDGFPASAARGPFKYAWQPGLPADSQTADGSTTTVGIPRLIIPAGYTIGSRTPDLGPDDQWSDVVIWWDDTIQQYTQLLPDYAYPPGAYYTYRQNGS